MLQHAKSGRVARAKTGFRSITAGNAARQNSVCLQTVLGIMYDRAQLNEWDPKTNGRKVDHYPEIIRKLRAVAQTMSLGKHGHLRDAIIPPTKIRAVEFVRNTPVILIARLIGSPIRAGVGPVRSLVLRDVDEPLVLPDGIAAGVRRSCEPMKKFQGVWWVIATVEFKDGVLVATEVHFVKTTHQGFCVDCEDERYFAECAIDRGWHFFRKFYDVKRKADDPKPDFIVCCTKRRTLVEVVSRYASRNKRARLIRKYRAHRLTVFLWRRCELFPVIIEGTLKRGERAQREFPRP